MTTGDVASVDQFRGHANCLHGRSHTIRDLSVSRSLPQAYGPRVVSTSNICEEGSYGLNRLLSHRIEDAMEERQGRSMINLSLYTVSSMPPARV